jgi:hypothetical protein
MSAYFGQFADSSFLFFYLYSFLLLSFIILGNANFFSLYYVKPLSLAHSILHLAKPSFANPSSLRFCIIKRSSCLDSVLHCPESRQKQDHLLRWELGGEEGRNAR